MGCLGRVSMLFNNHGTVMTLAQNAATVSLTEPPYT